MMIECTIRRAEGSTHVVGGIAYRFGPGDAPHVAEVLEPEHVAWFLSVPESFRSAEAPEARSRARARAPGQSPAAAPADAPAHGQS